MNILLEELYVIFLYILHLVEGLRTEFSW